MTFADLLPGESVFVDANVLVYHFGPHPAFGPACAQLIRRIENQELPGFTSTHALGEVAHQLMIAEASQLPGWGLGKSSGGSSNNRLPCKRWGSSAGRWRRSSNPAFRS
jgi:hypothetical protein